MLLFFASRFILTEAYALLLTKIISTPSNETVYLMFTIGNLILTVCIALPIFCRAMHFPIKTIPTLFQPQKKETDSIVPFLLVGFAAVSLVVLIECGFVYWNILDTASLSLGSGTMLLNKILQNILIMPIVEEVMFRGIVLRALHNHSTAAIITISTIAFAVGHYLNPINLLIAIPLGIILGLTALKTGNIRFSIFLHIVLNFYGAIAVPLLLQIGTILSTIILSLIFIISGGLILKKGYFSHISK